MPKNREKGHGAKSTGTPLREIIISGGIGAAAVLILLAVMALLMSVQDVPGRLAAPMVTLSLAAGTMLAGYRCGRRLHQNGIINGALTGGLMYLILLVAALTVPKNEPGLLALYKCLLMVVSGAIGGVLAVNKRSKVKPSHRPKSR